ncbi:MAG: hypothetical protein GY832_09955 [Chloroflexi bacterium]|nr:hypothetical protein [Chloroflexota bacterium]
MRKTITMLALLTGLVMLITITTITSTAEAQPALQTGNDENCITCHTSMETLQELAVEPEEGEALSEGEG